MERNKGSVVGVAKEAIKKDEWGVVMIPNGGQILYTRTSLKKDMLELLRILNITPREALASKDLDLSLSIVIGFRVHNPVMTQEVRDVLFELYEEGLSRK